MTVGSGREKVAMSTMNLQKFAARIREIEAAVYRRHQELPALEVSAPSYDAVPPPRGVASGPPVGTVKVGDQWGGYNQSVWLRGEIAVPADWAGETVVLLVRLGTYEAIRGDILMAGPEALAYIDGEPWQGIDRWHPS